MFKIANILTGFNLLSGIISIIFAFTGRLELAVLFIVIGAVFDFFDGFVARLLKQSGELGKQLDSLADMVTFGVAPGVIVFILLIISGAWEIFQSQGGTLDDFWSVGTFGANIQYWILSYLNDLGNNDIAGMPMIFSGRYKYLPFAALFIPFFSMFRLAKFNLDKRQALGFIGLPTPANSLFFASFALMLWDGFGDISWKTILSMNLIQLKVLISFVVLFSLLLVAEIKLFSLKFKDYSWANNKIKYSFLFCAIILLIALKFWSISIIILLYIIFSVVNNKLEKSSSQLQ